jgi:Fe-S-cluster containining protein
MSLKPDHTRGDRKNRRRPQAGIPVTARERLILGVYAGVDAAAGRELDRLRREKGIAPSCRPGCFQCCGQHILMNPEEAHALAQFVRRTFSPEEISGLQRRTQQWHAEDEIRLGRCPTPALSESAVQGPHALFCPLLAGGKCSAYPVRPVICRTHFVSSHPSSCRPAFDPRPAAESAVSLASVLKATRTATLPLSSGAEKAGRDASRALMLLPHWLAIEMGWDFAIEP